jgi:hypothetical protein
VIAKKEKSQEQAGDTDHVCILLIPLLSFFFSCQSECLNQRRTVKLVANFARKLLSTM